MIQPLTLAEQELTGHAIKATGRTAHDIDEHGAWFRVKPDPIIGDAYQNFNPLHNDADAFRLAIQLHLSLSPWSQGDARGIRASYDIEWHVALETADRDLCAAARLAIVELAAHLYRTSEDATP